MASSASTKMSLLNQRFLVVCLIDLLSFIVFSEAEASYAVYNIEVVNEFPHDPEAYTQGLLYAENNVLFESTGLYGRSSVRKVALLNGKVETVHEMRSSDFGEGLTLIGERLFQLTWLQDTGYIYDRYNLSKFKKFTHHMQDGWGLATDGKVLFGSDGTSTLYKIDPARMKVIKKQVVKSQGHEVPYLNELELKMSNMLSASDPMVAMMNMCPVLRAPIDWKETPEAHCFFTDLPGLSKEDVKVEVEDGRVLKISGKWKAEELLDEKKTDDMMWSLELWGFVMVWFASSMISSVHKYYHSLESWYLQKFHPFCALCSLWSIWALHLLPWIGFDQETHDFKVVRTTYS